MTLRRLTLLVLAATTITQGCAKRAMLDSTLPETTLTEDWLFLNDPITTDPEALLGNAAYSIEDDDYFLDCYTADSVKIERSYGMIVVEKTAQSSVESFANVLELLGVNIDTKRISTARIQLDSVMIAKATGTVIDRKTKWKNDKCRCRRVTEVPRYPALEQLIGAHRFTFTATNEQGTNITSDLLGENPAGVKFKGESRDSARISFEDFRWIAARFVGFDLVKDEYPKEYILQLDTPQEIEIEDALFQVHITRRESGGYLVRKKNLIFSAEQDKKPMGEGTNHQWVGRRTPTGQVVWWKLSSVGPDSVRLVLQTRGFKRVSFKGEKDRQRLIEWSNR